MQEFNFADEGTIREIREIFLPAKISDNKVISNILSFFDGITTPDKSLFSLFHETEVYSLAIQTIKITLMF